MAQTLSPRAELHARSTRAARESQRSVDALVDDVLDDAAEREPMDERDGGQVRSWCR
jgi:hypothetical protein